MPSYKTFVMEIRPRLQSCNVFLTFDNAADSQMKIDLKEHEIVIRTNNCTESIQITEYKILPQSLSSLQINSNYLNFRFQTENVNKTAGQFKSEFVVYNLSQKLLTATIKSNPEIDKNVLYVIKCSNCRGPVSNEIKFGRVLPLPSENVDPSEWFCHKSDNDNILNLNPKSHDCFYTHCYMRLNRNIISNYKSTNSVIVCQRCFAWLGIILKSDVVQLWFNTITIESNSSSISSNPLRDFFTTISLSLNDMILAHSKLLFECTNLNTTDFLCIWILERNLQLYVKGHNFQYVVDRVTNENDTFSVAKVLFKFDTKPSDIIAEWLKDVKVTHIQISKPMMINGLNHLYDMCKLIPDSFRISNNFYVSYLIM